jgi:MFS family permease
VEKQGAPRVFYGWIIVFVGLWVTLVIFGVVNSFSVFFKPLAQEFGWDRGLTSLAYSLSWVSFGVLSIAAGRLVDRYGPRTVMFIGTAIFAVGTVLLSQLNSLWQLYLIFGLMLPIGKAANVIPLVATVLNWFTERRGLALSIAQSQGVGTVLISPIAAWMIAVYGWRASYFVLGGLVFATALPLLVLIRRRPSDLNLRSYGETGGGREPHDGLLRADWTLNQVLHSKMFWVANAIVFSCCACHSLLMLHLVNFFTDRGVPATSAATMFASISMFAMVGKLAGGALADRIGGQRAITVFLALQTIMVPCFYAAWQPWHYYAIGALFGVGMGGPMPMYALLFREFFGQKSIGAILGVFTAMSSTGMALGGYMGGILHDRFDGYTEAFVLSLLAGTTATLLTFLLKPPEAARPPLRVPAVPQWGTQRAS